DLMRFPESERHHVCWLPDKLESCIVGHGFVSTTLLPQGSKTGNAWFNLVAGGAESSPLSEEESLALVVEARQEQWQLWSALDKMREDELPERSELIEALDLDLQLTSLTRMLHSAGVIDVKIEGTLARRMRHREFSGRVDKFVKAEKLDKKVPPQHGHFRERGKQLDEMEAFLRSQIRLALVHGGVGTGKTAFVNHLLDGRLYDKSFLWIDGKTSRSFWPFIEQLFAQAGLHITSDLLNAFEELEYDNVQPAISQFLNKFASQIIIIVDDFDQLVDSNGYVIDTRVQKLLELILSKSQIKLILTAKTDFLPQAFKASCAPDLPVVVHMGRFWNDQTVENVLDDHFDRAKSGVQEYPVQLIEAIDRHPLIATLTAQILGREGKAILLNEEFISEVRRKLRSELTERLVDDQSRDAIEISSKLRVPVPVSLLEQFTTRDSIHYARVSEVLYPTPDRVWTELLTTLGLFRARSVSDLTPTALKNESIADTAFHSAAADAYFGIYKLDDDPKWIRESHFHRMLSGKLKVDELAGFAGKYYVPELVSSAIYCYRKQKNYKVALELFEAARTLTKLDEQALMWRASCLLRTGASRRGEDEYRALVENYPTNTGIKSSHVDALLHLNDWTNAKSTLEKYGLESGTSNWVSTQWGRVHLGLHRYDLCIPIFEAIISGGAADPHVYVYLARANQQFGDLPEAIRVLRAGMLAYPENHVIETSLGTDLERAREDDEALEILSRLFASDPNNSRAALGLIRIKLRQGDLHGAKQMLKRAKRFAISAMEWVISTAEAEITIADGNPKSAAYFLRDRVSKDDSLFGIMMDAYTSLILSTDDQDAKNAFFEEVSSVKPPNDLSLNAPVLITRANLAIAAQHKPTFESVIVDLSSTKISQPEIDRLQQKWEAFQNKEGA
ncbi:MAG: tetratricopeptide repeat protein, partial [Roseobacter sp.]